jgi:hypothetical protein
LEVIAARPSPWSALTIAGFVLAILTIRKDALTGHHRFGQDAIAKTIRSDDPEDARPPPEEGRTAIDDPILANPLCHPFCTGCGHLSIGRCSP